MRPTCAPRSLNSSRANKRAKNELPRLEALNEPDDAAGEVEELNGFFRRYALAA